MKTYSFAVSGVLMFVAIGAQAQDLKGAKNAVQQLIEAPKTANANTNAFKTNLDAFLKNSSSMSNEEAAKQWTALLKQAYESKAAAGENYYSGADTVSQVLFALPGPDSWVALRSTRRLVL